MAYRDSDTLREAAGVGLTASDQIGDASSGSNSRQGIDRDNPSRRAESGIVKTLLDPRFSPLARGKAEDGPHTSFSSGPAECSINNGEIARTSKPTPRLRYSDAWNNMTK